VYRAAPGISLRCMHRICTKLARARRDGACTLHVLSLPPAPPAPHAPAALHARVGSVAVARQRRWRRGEREGGVLAHITLHVFLLCRTPRH
jgi:hypothetical protein